MEKLFDNILDKDEVVLKTFKPNKKKLYFSSIIASIIIPLFFLIPMIIGILTEGELLMLLIPLAFIILIPTIALAFTKLHYNKLVYAYSNKRIIIRTGIIGVDFKSLDMAMIGATNVYVSLLDKILGNKTGSITFGSTASPMVSVNSGQNPYKFSNIDNPYELYKEIKNVIDDYKSANK